MNDYVPTIDDIEELVASQPEKFSSPITTQRSIDAARKQGDIVQEITARNQYQDYRNNGGEPFGPNGQAPTKSDPLGQQFGSANCNCVATEPCCLNGMKFTCSHGTDRMVLPLVDATKQPILVVVTDKPDPSVHDRVTISPVLKKSGRVCAMPTKEPKLRITGTYTADWTIAQPRSWDVEYHDASHLGSTSITRLFTALRHTLFGDIDDLAKTLGLEILSCARRADLNAAIHVYPKLEWGSSGFSFEVTGMFMSNLTFSSGVGFEGNLSGTLLDTSFEIGVANETDPVAQTHAKSMIPFLDTVLDRMKSLTGQENGAVTGMETRSRIEVRHKFELGNSTFKLAEHPTDHSKVGIDSEIKIGYAPILGIKATIDLIDLVLTVAKGVPAASGLASALQKARDVAAKGVGDKKSFGQFSAHAAITLAADSSIGGGVTIKRGPNDDSWDGSGDVNGKIVFTLAGVIQAKGRVYRVSGAFAAESSAVTDLTATLKTLTRTESKAAKGAKFNTKIEWGGLKIKYSAVASTEIGTFRSKAKREGELILQESSTWYEETY